jgi:hypothetical protein
VLILYLTSYTSIYNSVDDWFTVRYDSAAYVSPASASCFSALATGGAALTGAAFTVGKRSASHKLTSVSAEIPRRRASSAMRANRSASMLMRRRRGNGHLEFDLVCLIPVIGETVCVPELSDFLIGACLRDTG